MTGTATQERRVADLYDEAAYDEASQVQRRRIHVKSGDAETCLQLQCRLFFPQELDAMLRSAGFHILRKFGTFAASPFVSGCDHQLVVCGQTSACSGSDAGDKGSRAH